MRQRARRDEDKAERVGAILAAAREVWATASYADFNVAEVARLAGVVKGTIYIYFPTKERLLLAVFESYLDDYFDAIHGALAAGRRRWSPAALTETLFTHLGDPLLRLLPIAAPILEKNVDHRTLAMFEGVLQERLAFTGALIDDRLRRHDGAIVIQRALVVAAGLAASMLPIDFRREFALLMEK